MSDLKQCKIGPDDVSWRTPAFRHNVIAKIDKSTQRSGMPSCNSIVLESHIFQKAKSKQEYLHMVAKLILHVRELRNRKFGIDSPGTPQGLASPTVEVENNQTNPGGAGGAGKYGGKKLCLITTDSDDGLLRTLAIRQNVVAKIVQSINQSGRPTSRNSIEMENDVFQKARSKEEYINLVARLLLQLRDSRVAQGMAGGNLMGQGVQQNPNQGPMGPNNMNQNPPMGGQIGINPQMVQNQMNPDMVEQMDIEKGGIGGPSTPQGLDGHTGGAGNNQPNPGGAGDAEGNPGGQGMAPDPINAVQNLEPQGQMGPGDQIEGMQNQMAPQQNSPIAATNLLQTPNQRPQLSMQQIQNNMGMNPNQGLQNPMEGQMVGQMIPNQMGPGGMNPQIVQNQMNPNMVEQMDNKNCGIGDPGTPQGLASPAGEVENNQPNPGGAGGAGDNQVTVGQDDGSWRTPAFRHYVVAKVDESIQQSGRPTSHNSIDMENHVFQKAKFKEEYLNMVANLILQFRDIGFQVVHVTEKKIIVVEGLRSQPRTLFYAQNILKKVSSTEH